MTGNEVVQSSCTASNYLRMLALRTLKTRDFNQAANPVAQFFHVKQEKENEKLGQARVGIMQPKIYQYRSLASKQD